VDLAWLKERAAYEAEPAHAIEVIEKPRRWHAAIAPLKEALERAAKEVEASRKAQEQYDKWPEWRRQRESGPDRMAWLWYERAGQLLPATKRGYGKVWAFEGTAESPLEVMLNALFAGVWKQVTLCRQKAREEEAGRQRDAPSAAGGSGRVAAGE
jgi:hypothetical protein